MEVVWDPNKAITNFQKHGVHFSDAEIVFYDPNAFTREDIKAEGEQRFVTIGSDAIGHILVVVYVLIAEKLFD